MNRIWEKSYPPGVKPPEEYPEVTVPELLERTAAKYPHRPALIFEENVITYGQLHEMSRSLAGSLARMGLRPGDRTALFMNNCPQFMISLFAVLRQGGVVVNNISPMCVEREVEAVFRDNEISMAIMESSLWPKLETIRHRLPLKSVIFTDQYDLARPLTPHKTVNIPRTDLPADSFINLLNGEPANGSVLCRPGDIALFQLTGGSTGLPKAAMLTHRNLVANVTQAGCHLDDLADSWQVLLPNMPFVHIYGVTCGVLRACAGGWTTIVMPKFSVRDVLHYVARYPVTILNSVPILFSGLIEYLETDVDARKNFSHIRMAGCGSAPLPERVFRRFFELTGVELCQGYGLTESSPIVCSNPVNGPKKSGSVGTPLPGIDVKIVDVVDDTRELPLGEAGELLVRGPQVMKGYYNRPKETEQALAGGFLRTGDIASMDEDGYVHIVGRKKDMVISGGYNIYPAEIDELILSHPKVADVCTIGIPEPEKGEVLKAYVVLKPGEKMTEAEVLDYCRANLSKFKVPYEVEFLGALPRDQVRKVRRETLRQEYMKQHEEKSKTSDWTIF